MLITLLIPTSGSARVLGLDVVKDAREVRKRIGYVFGGDRGLYERLSALDNLRYFAELYALPARDQRRRIDELLELVGLKGREKERVEGYSRGMRQRLHIARGLLHDPPVVFLDEPTIGVDPVGARDLRATIASLTESGKTVLLTTHYMFEADSLCDRIAVINKGEIVAEGTPRALKSIVADKTVVEIETFGIADETIDRLRQASGRRLRLGRGAGTGAGAPRPVRERARTDADAAGDARRNDGRPGRRPGADARGRVRRARRPRRVRTLRLLTVGWVFHFKMLSRSSFNGVLGDPLSAVLRDGRLLSVPGREPARAALRVARSLGNGHLVGDEHGGGCGTAAGALARNARVARGGACQLLARDAADHDRDVDDRHLLDGGDAALGPRAVRDRRSTSFTPCCSASPSRSRSSRSAPSGS